MVPWTLYSKDNTVFLPDLWQEFINKKGCYFFSHLLILPHFKRDDKWTFINCTKWVSLWHFHINTEHNFILFTPHGLLLAHWVLSTKMDAVATLHFLGADNVRDTLFPLSLVSQSCSSLASWVINNITELQVDSTPLSKSILWADSPYAYLY